MDEMFIIVTFREEYLHRWPKAPEGHYLAELHRHELHFKVIIQVFGDDRELEFIDVKHKLRERFRTYLCHHEPVIADGTASVEYIARALAGDVQRLYGRDRTCSVEVLEDGECGSFFIGEAT